MLPPATAGRAGRSWIEYPAFWLVSLTLALFLGQALAGAPLTIPRAALFALPLPGFFFFFPRLRAWGFLGMLILAFLSAGYVRHHRLLHPGFGPDHLRVIAGDGAPVHLEGRLYREPERLTDRSRWYFQAESIWRPTGAQRAEGNVLITVGRERGHWRYGDRLRLWLRLRAPRNPGNPGEFDYEGFLARRRIYLTAYLQSDQGVELLGREAHGFWSRIGRLRGRIRDFLGSSLAQEQAALMKALVIGERGGIGTPTRESFTVAGVAHLLAISGLHVGMLGLAVFVLVRFLGSFSVTLLLRFSLPKLAASVALLAVLFYAALAGGMIPTVRAALMTAVYVFAVLLDREDELLSSLCIAALVTGLYWPGAVMDISFQLSFLAVLSIIWGLRAVQRWWPERRPQDALPHPRRFRLRLRSIGLYLAVPVLASVGTGPVIAHHFGHVSLVGFIANPIVVPIVGLAVVPLGFLIASLSLIADAPATPAVWLAEPLLSLVLGLVRFFAALPMASISVPTPNVLEIGLAYLLMVSLLVLPRPRYGAVLLGAVVVGAIAGGAHWWTERWDRRTLRVTYLSVGHGDAAVVEFPGSKVLVIDAGGASTGDFDPGESMVAPFLRSRKILRVHYVCVSHPRVDHYGGMKAVVERFRPAQFWSGPVESRSARYQELEEAAAKLGVKRLVLGSGDPCFFLEGVQLCPLYPAKGDRGESSLVLRLSFGRAAFLFAGDLARRDERRLAERGVVLRSTVLKVPRHGSLSSSTEAFVAAVAPKVAIFSAGYRHPFGLPREEVVSRYAAAGAEILRTDRDGAIIVETDGERLHYRTYGSSKSGTLFLVPGETR